MKFPMAHYGTTARILGREYLKERMYISLLKSIAKEMGGKIPNEYRGIIMEHARAVVNEQISQGELGEL